MHLLTTSSTTLDEIAEPIDLRQEPGDILVLSFADTDLAGLAAAWAIERDALPSVRLAHLRDLRHPLSVDLWIDRVGVHAKVILLRLLGGLDWWRYGVERIAAMAREQGIALAILPGEDRDDPRLADASTLPRAELDTLLRYFREGGRENLRALLRRLARYAGTLLDAGEPRPVPRAAAYLPGDGAVDLDRLDATLAPGKAVIPIIFYRAHVLAADTAPIDALCVALCERGLSPAPLIVTSLKDKDCADFVRHALARLEPAVIVTTTAFAAGAGADASTPLDGPDVPVLQAVIANTKRAAWRDSARGLGAADLAMHIVLPELDGRVLAGAIAFKEALPAQGGLAFAALANRPEPDRIAIVADRVAALVRLQRTPRSERRIAVLMPDYPGQPGRTAYAVGLDVPASVIALLIDLAQSGYRVDGAPDAPRGLLDALSVSLAALSLDDYMRLLRDLPPEVAERVQSTWGDATADPDMRDGAFRFRARLFGNILVALPPDRGRTAERRADYHDPLKPPRHALLAFGLWLQHVARVDALVHMGAHGTLEWLPGKAVALSSTCFPEAVVGRLPVIYPFIVSNPGEAAQAKRRIAAVTIGHLPPPLAASSLTGDARELERLVDEYAQADGLDRRRRERLATLIIDTAQRTGLAREAGLDAATDSIDALRRIDAWLCDLKDLAIKDGLHVYGRVPVVTPAPGLEGEDRVEGLVDPSVACLETRQQRITTNHPPPRTPSASDPPPASAASGGEGSGVGGDFIRQAAPHAHSDSLDRLNALETCAAVQTSAEAERVGLLAALDGRRVAPGPAGSPARGRRDVLPTGRNLFTADPRTLPTQTAMDIGGLAADEVIRSYLQEHGEMPRALVVDLWGSATLRTGGEEIAQGLSFMGCRPIWDHATGRVTGIEVLPTASLGRPRIDVTWRVSGLFRDLFPAQIALIDAAVRAVAERAESDEENPLAAARRANGGNAHALARVFGNAPGAYGSGIEAMLGREHDRGEIGAAYLAASSHAYGGVDADGTLMPEAFAARVASADLLVHPSDDPARDLLEGAEDAAFVGGFAAAATSLGHAPDLVMLDVTDPQRPRARPLARALARIVRARAISPRFIEGQMRHGPRGAAEFAETVDRLVAFAELTDAVPSALFDLVHDAYVADPRVREFILRENPEAARAIAERLAAARRRGLWHPRRNDVDADLALAGAAS
ncbi:MAG: cobaltochelatase subunit CobN [Rhodoplanes sp.]